jgi:hypothetical protein
MAFVAVIFVTSYAAFNNNGAPPATTTTVGAVNTIYVYGTANGVVVNYTSQALITVTNKSQMSELNTTLGVLEANGTVNFASYNSTTYEAVLSGINTYQLYLYLSNSLTDANIIVGGPAYIRLPGTINMHYSASSTLFPITFPPRNYTVNLARTVPIGSAIPIKISAIIETNGTIFNGQIKLTET